MLPRTAGLPDSAWRYLDFIMHGGKGHVPGASPLPYLPLLSSSPCHPDQSLASRHPVIALRLCGDTPLDPRWGSHMRVTLIKSYEECGEGELALWRLLAARRSARLILLTRPRPSWLARARQRL
ncbi:hypothetical protein E2C01_043506 [Portunus trituberculatus]|uniref:Uncharacterized protein n=1 Tax=Portunus trituberculatus TaxID=210409 RepID=A0A5B7FZR7_PORTR|nr:hypothetical protein [Portunus trituberculatus]